MFLIRSQVSSGVDDDVVTERCSAFCCPVFLALAALRFRLLQSYTGADTQTDTHAHRHTHTCEHTQ